jgi:hypothetical protein
VTVRQERRGEEKEKKKKKEKEKKKRDYIHTIQFFLLFLHESRLKKSEL